MPSEESKALLRYLVNSSRAGLGSFQLAKLNRVANSERQLRELVRALVEDLAYVYLAELLREHGEELAAELGAPRRRRKLPKPDP